MGAINTYEDYQTDTGTDPYITDAILHEGVLWLACDRRPDPARPVLWRCDHLPDAGDEHVKLAGVEFRKVDISGAVAVELPSDIKILSAFGIIEDDLYAIGSKRVGARESFVLLKLVSGAWVEAIPYTDTGLSGSGIKKLLPAPKGGILAVGGYSCFLIKHGALVSSGNGLDAVRFNNKLYKTVLAEGNNPQYYIAALYETSADGIKWKEQNVIELRLANGKCNSMVVLRGYLYAITADYAGNKFNLCAFNPLLSIGRIIASVSKYTQIMFAFGEAVFLREFTYNSALTVNAIAVSDEAITKAPFPWTIQAEHVTGEEICLLSHNNEVVIGSIGLSVFNISLEWGTGEGANRPQIDVMQIQWKASDEIGESPQINSARLEWGSGIAPPGESDKILWLVNDDLDRTCYKVRFCTSADETIESQLRCIIRADLETFDIDAWQTYEEFHCNELYTLERPGHEVRIGIIAPDELVPVDFNLQYIREED